MSLQHPPCLTPTGASAWRSAIAKLYNIFYSQKIFINFLEKNFFGVPYLPVL